MKKSNDNQKKKNWFLRHKIISGIIIFIIVMIIIGSNSEESKKSFEQGKQDAKTSISKFSKDDALLALKGYKLKNNVESLNKSTIGMYLATCMEEIVLQNMKIDNTTSTGNWNVDDVTNDKYTISYKFTSSGTDRVYTWEVSQDSIKAINGKAITITPEFGPQEKEVSGTDNEKEIYEYSTNLYKKYESTLVSYDAETKATSETAKKFGITEEEVEDIVSRLMDTKI